MLLASGGPVAAASSVTACLARPRRVVGRGIPRPAAAARGVHVGTAGGVRGGGAGAARQRGEGGKRLCAVGSTSGGLLFPFAERGTRRPSEARGVRVRAAGRGGVDTARQCGWGGGVGAAAYVRRSMRVASGSRPFSFTQSCSVLPTGLSPSALFFVPRPHRHRALTRCGSSSSGGCPYSPAVGVTVTHCAPILVLVPPPPRLPHATTR